MRTLISCITLAIITPTAAQAATLDEYVTACANNTGNGMNADICKCVGQDTLDKYGQPGLDYMHANASKDSARLHQSMGAMDQQTKMGLIMHTMMAPSKCAGSVARQRPKKTPDTAGGSASGAIGEAATAAEGADAAVAR